MAVVVKLVVNQIVLVDDHLDSKGRATLLSAYSLFEYTRLLFESLRLYAAVNMPIKPIIASNIDIPQYK